MLKKIKSSERILETVAYSGKESNCRTIKKSHLQFTNVETDTNPPSLFPNFEKINELEREFFKQVLNWANINPEITKKALQKK